MPPMRYSGVVLFVLSWVLGGAARAQQVQLGPRLLLEPGAHEGPVLRLGVDAAGRYLVTGARDHTARLWDLYSGALVQTLRPSLGPDAPPMRAGPAEAVALSRDGKTVALAPAPAGPTVPEEGAIFLFDRASGTLRRRLSSPPVTALDLGPGGRLVTAGADGVLRLYDSSLRLVRQAQRPAPPGSVRFSPDGRRIAVGHRGSAPVAVLSSEDLEPALQLAGADSGELDLVAWSPDGTLLYAAGDLRVGASYAVRRWEDGGAGRFQDLPLSVRPLTDLAALANKDLIVAAGGPLWTRWSAARKTTQGPPGPRIDFLNSDIHLSASGTRVRFAYGTGTAAVYSVEEHGLVLGPPPDGRLRPASRSAAGLVLSGCRDGAPALLNGAPVPLPPAEACRSLATAPDGQSFLLGTDSNLRSFGRGGQPRWQVALPAPALALNLSGSGQLAVAALADGTLRWYAGAEGRELLALFAHGDRKRWVAFTPSGYYDSSLEGATLLGWQLDRGAEQAADFFPASLLRAHRYRPDVVARVLLTLDEERALAEADAEAEQKEKPLPVLRLLPPVVTVLSPADGTPIKSPEAVVRLAIRSPSGEPVTGVRALVHGRLTQSRELAAPAPARGGPAPQEETRTMTVTVPQENSTLALLADTAHGSSAPALLHLRWAGAQAAPSTIKPRLYVLAIGVSRYRQADMSLDYPAKDARDLAAAFKGQQGKAYREVEARVLTDQEATRDRIVEALGWLRGQGGAEDVSVLFLAGHGINDPGTGKYYYLPHDADMAAPGRTMVAGEVVQTTLSNVLGKVLLFLDTCHSGSVLDPSSRRSLSDLSRFTSELSSTESGVVVYAASSGKQLSKESIKWGNGAFTLAAVEGLRGRADVKRTGRITVSTLQTYLSDRVRELTREEQTPTTAIPGTVPDFLIVRVPVKPLLYKKWWFWGALGVAAAGAVTGALLATEPWAPRIQEIDFLLRANTAR